MRSPLFSSFFDLVARFRTSREGAIIPIFGIMLILVVVMAGAAVDVSRVVNAREKLSYALDAAALAAATRLSTQALSDAEISRSSPIPLKETCLMPIIWMKRLRILHFQ